MIGRLVSMLFICVFLFFSLPAGIECATPDKTGNITVQTAGMPELKAASAILIDAERGQILYQKDSHQLLHISAACKLMTILIAVEAGKLDSNVTISIDSVDTQGSALSLEVGKKYLLEDLLYGIMLTSANDAAIAVAEAVSGDMDKFVTKMNEMASGLKMNETHFTNSTGLYNETQFTSAYDIALLIKYAISNPVFNKIFSTQYKPWDYGTKNTKILTNQNKLFWSYNGTNGGKTGYNVKDLQTVISTATRDNMKLICVVLDSPENELFNDASRLFDAGFGNFKRSILVHKGDQLKTVKIEGVDIGLACKEDVLYIHPTGESYVSEFSTISSLKMPVKSSQLAGTARYVLNDGTIINIGLYPLTEITAPQNLLSYVKTKITENKDIFVLVMVLTFTEIILVLLHVIKLIRKHSQS